MKFVKQIKSAWKNGFNYKGISTKQEFIDYFIARLILFLILTFPFDFVISVLNYIAYDTLQFNLFGSFIVVIAQTLSLIKFIFLIGSFIVEFPLTIRCLRNYKKNFYWVLFNFFSPIGLIIILLFPLRNVKSSKDLIEK